MLGTAGLATALGAAKTAVEKIVERRKAPGPQRVWNALVKHQQSVEHELRGVQVQPGTTGAGPYWGLSDTPSMSVGVTTGTIIADHLPRPREQGEAPRPGYAEDVWAACDCGSCRGFRYCCRRLRVDF